MGYRLRILIRVMLNGKKKAVAGLVVTRGWGCLWDLLRHYLNMIQCQTGTRRRLTKPPYD